MSSTIPYTHWAYFTDKVAAEACARDLADYVTRLTPTVTNDGRWLLRAGRDVQIGCLVERHQEVEAVVIRHGGDYDGGEATYLDGKAVADPDLIAPASDTAVRDHVRALLRQNLADEDARQEAIDAAEKAGRRIVDGGQTHQDEWEITDWRTKETLAKGADGLHGYEAAGQRLDPDEKWLHVDNLDTEYTQVEPVGIPASLASALEDWVGSPGTPDEDIAEFVGWSVEEVARHREEV